MGIEIILYDSSPVTQKIFFHILYHYSPIVHRIDQPSKLMEKVQYSNPDIIFIDANFSDDIKNQIDQKKKEDLKNIPVILMAKKDLDQTELKSSAAHDFLKKPIEAGKLRELINRFVPKTKSNILTKHLKFPSLSDFNEEKTKQDSISTVSSRSTIKEFEQKEELLHTAPDKSQSSNQTTDGTEDINPITATGVLNKQKDSSADPPNQKTYQHTDTGIKPVTATQSTDIQKDSPADPSRPILDQKTSQQPTDTGIKPVTATQSTNIQKDSPADPSHQKPHLSMDSENINSTEEETNATDVKVLQASSLEPKSSSEPKSYSKVNNIHTVDDPNLNTQLKNQINEYIEQLSKETVTKEITEQLKHYAEKNSQEIIQKITEKAVWQVVPELAKQLITKELNKLLKEETEEQEDSK